MGGDHTHLPASLLLLELGLDASMEVAGLAVGASASSGDLLVDAVASLGSFDYAVSITPRLVLAWPDGFDAGVQTSVGAELTGLLTLLDNVVVSVSVDGGYDWIGPADTTGSFGATLDADWFPRLPVFASVTISGSRVESTVGHQPLAPFGPTLSGSHTLLSGLVEASLALGRQVSVSALLRIAGQLWPDGMNAQLQLTTAPDLQFTIEPIVSLALAGPEGARLALSGALLDTRASSPFRVQRSWSVQLDLTATLAARG